MPLHLSREQIALFRSLTPERQRALIEQMTPIELLELDADFEIWAHEGQLPPEAEGWRVWLMMAGRGFGKTRAGAEWVHRLARRLPVRFALVAATIAEARSIMVEGASGLLSVARRQRHRVTWEPSLGQLRWPAGGLAQLYSGDNADGLRGPEHDFAWCDELAKWRQAEPAWDNLQMGLRGRPRARALVTTTPRTIPLLERILKEPWTVTTGGRTSDNINLPREFVDVMVATYGGTRLGRQELDGELVPDLEGALWTRELVERCRVRPLHHPSDGPPPHASHREELKRIVVGVDPPAGVGEGGDECGIVVCGTGRDGVHYVLADESVAGLSPEGWANRVAAAVARWGAARVVAEANNGGAMVESVLKAAEAGLRVRLVHATRGKAIRAEPVALKFESGRAKLAGSFPELEAQLCGLIAGGGYEGPGRSPDRADAMVWAMTDLMETRSGVPRVARL